MRQNALAPQQDGQVGLADDLLVGIKPIAAFIGQPPRRTQHWAETGAIPVKKTGHLWTATKSALRQHFGGAGNAR